MGEMREFGLKLRLFLEVYPWRRIDPVPWTPLPRPLAECRVAIVSSAGLVLPEQEPFDAALNFGPDLDNDWGSWAMFGDEQFYSLGGQYYDYEYTGSGNPLPAATVFDENVPSPDPVAPSCAIEFECYEGMLVQITGGTVISSRMLAPAMAKRGLSAPEASGRLRF